MKWYKSCVLVAVTATNQNLKFKITDTKLYIPVATSSNQLFKQLESGFKRTISWNKYPPKTVN